MNKGKALTLVAAGLVAGLVLGSMGLASAAPTTDPATGESLGRGARMGFAIRDAGARMIDLVAELTGLDEGEIHDRRVDGESIADIATSEGVDASDVVDAALARRTEILEAKVADGSITEAEKDAMFAQMTERMTERVESTELGGRGKGGGGGRGMSGGQGGGGNGAGACGGVCTQVPPTE